MRAKSFRRGTSGRIVRSLTYLIGVLLVLDFLLTLNSYKTFNRNLVANTILRRDDLPSRARDQKIYIVAQFWTSAALIIDYWAPAVKELIGILGPDNVYLSILGSASLDNTDEVLRWLDSEFEQLGVKRTMIIDPTTHKDSIDAGPTYPDGTQKPGWIYTGDSKPPGQKELRRIPYLAELRNRGLEPMLRLQREKGIAFDKILYINDVIFKPSDVLSLLATNAGVYDVACAIDFHYPPQFYDTFVLRDSNGDCAANREFPFFRSRTSRSPMLKGLPAPVKSCWNGMLISDAAPYYDQHHAVSTHDLDGLPMKTTDGLRFRGIPDALAAKHLEASECCLIHADLINRGQAQKGLFMNPVVRVGYTDMREREGTSYGLVHSGPNGIGYVTLRGYFYGIWHNRWMRWVQLPWFEMRNVRAKIKKWKQEGLKFGEIREEIGAWCTVGEMQIIIENGWKHVRKEIKV